jgi:hypothetical protein
MRCRALWLAALLAALAFTTADPSRANPEAGWWWNPAESGRGFFIESLDDLIYMAGYLYQSDGHALWVVAGGPNKDPYNYSGRLLTYSGGQTMTGTYHAPNAPQDIGAVSIHFSDDTHATLTWPGGNVQLQREIFGTGAPAFKPATGWFWNPAESGRGYSIEVQGNLMFFVGFMYEDDGRPVWLFSAGPVSADDPTTYSGPLLQFANGQTMSGPYQAPGNPATVGHLDIAFTADNAGTLTFTRPSPASASSPRADSTATVPIQSEFDKAGTYVLPPGFEGIVKYDSVVLTTGAGVEQNIHLNVVLTLVWVQNEDLSLPGVYTYDLEKGDIILVVNGTQSATDISCTIVGSLEQQFQNPLQPASLPGFNLVATSHRSYTFQGRLDPGFLSYPQTMTCTSFGQTTTTTVQLPIPLEASGSGAIVSDVIAGALSKSVTKFPVTSNSFYSWSFHAIR